MKTVAYYISDYGFGHATRSIAIIRELFNRYNGSLKVIICNSYAINFLKDSLVGLNIEYRKINTDVGYVLKQNSMEINTVGLKTKYFQFIKNWERKLQSEKGFLIDNKIDFVISDISPLPFLPSKELDIPAIGISNFTWYTAYLGLINEKDLTCFRNAYLNMEYFFKLAGSNENDWITVQNESFGFISRNPTIENVAEIVQRVNLKRNKIIVYFGLGMKVDINLNELKLWDNESCVFLVSNNVDIELPNVYKIPENYTESQNYIAASDLVISKAGWGTVSEGILNSKPLLILDRNEMNEDKNTISYLQDINHVNTFKWDELSDLVINPSLLEELNRQSLGRVKNDITNIVSKLLEIIG
jgi:uncharacterized protein (TIGR00661 family)